MQFFPFTKGDFPPRRTVWRWLRLLCDRCIFERIDHDLPMLERERVGREASPTAAVLDSQSVKTCESGGPRGCDAGKKVSFDRLRMRGRKRHALDVESSVETGAADGGHEVLLAPLLP